MQIQQSKRSEKVRPLQESLLMEDDEEPPGPSGLVVTSSQPRPESALSSVIPLGLDSQRRASHPARNPRTRAFRRKFYPTVSDREWNDWHWQLRNRVQHLSEIERVLRLSPDEIAALAGRAGALPASITPYYLSLLDPVDPMQPLRRTALPTVAECRMGPGEADDPLGEDADSPVPGLVHRYPDRVLLLANDRCAMYCRYCTRSRMVAHGEMRPDPERLLKAVAYIRNTPTIRDVLISGGDPLLLPDEVLGWLLGELRGIPHVEVLRIGTKVPAVLPQRVTPALVRTLRRFHPLWMSLHFTHPDECTPETRTACERLADGGIPLGSQTVLLRGVNDSVDVMRDLMHGIQRMRVRPYYLYQCDPISGSAHFRTSVETGLDIIEGLRGHTSGYAVPTYVIDAPGGGGKIPLAPDYVQGREGADVLLRNYAGRQYRYPDPDGAC